MEKTIIDINKARQKLKKGPGGIFLTQKPFAPGMYRWLMFIISYYSRVKEALKIDYDSFMIIQTVVSHSLYHQNKKKSGSSSYEELEREWLEALTKNEKTLVAFDKRKSTTLNIFRLTISSVCLVMGLPKETVRRKINQLCKKNLLKISKKDGILIGVEYKKVFHEFVPQPTLEISRLLNNWEQTGALKSILNFKI